MMTVKAQIHRMREQLTATERKVASVVLADYPFSGLLTIQDLADKTQVSAPSISRFVGKIGCAGYQDFQRRLIEELKQGYSSPIDLRSTQDLDTRDGFLDEYFSRLGNQLLQARDSISEADFDATCDALADPKRSIYLLGGRVTDFLASFLTMNLQFIRPGVTHVDTNPEMWPEHILRMKKRDIVVLFDFRRYQSSLLRFAEQASQAAHPQIILITDPWLSPISRVSSRIFAMPIEVGTAWDTFASAYALVEAMVVRISEDNWDTARPRLESWDRLRIEPQGPGNGKIPGDDSD